MSKKIFLLLVAVTFFTFGGGLFLAPQKTNALTVGPVKIELEGNPGDTLSGEFWLFNEGIDSKTFYPTFESYKEKGGDKVFAGEKKDLALWIKTDVESVALGPKEQKKIPFTVQLPKDAPAGSHFAVAWWSTAPPPAAGGSQVAIVTRAGILMLLTVSGDVQESARIASFSVGTENNKIFDSFPQNFSVEVENIGNAYIKPMGAINIKNLFSRSAAVFDVNKVDLEVYPKTIKGLRVTSSAKKESKSEEIIPGFFNGLKRERNNFALGPYTANLSLKFGKKNPQNLAASLTFWVIPWRILTIAAFILILILLFFTKGIKAYNNWIIKRAQKIYEKTSNNKEE